MHLISKILEMDLITKIPNININKERFCDACMKGKHTRSSFKMKNIVLNSRAL